MLRIIFLKYVSMRMGLLQEGSVAWELLLPGRRDTLPSQLCICRVVEFRAGQPSSAEHFQGSGVGPQHSPLRTYSSICPHPE